MEEEETIHKKSQNNMRRNRRENEDRYHERDEMKEVG